MAYIFNILDFISGLTGYVFDKAVLENIALSRGVIEYTQYTQLDERTKDLLRADLLYTAYCSPNVIASETHAHGSFSKTTGSQTTTDKESLYEIFMGIYNKYDDPMAKIAAGSNVTWLDY